MTNNKQQTAVEWQHIELSKFLNGKSEFTDVHDILIKAKEMEKIQKFHMFNCGRQYQLTGEGTFKQVYQEIYGGGDK